MREWAKTSAMEEIEGLWTKDGRTVVPEDDVLQ